MATQYQVSLDGEANREAGEVSRLWRGGIRGPPGGWGQVQPTTEFGGRGQVQSGRVMQDQGSLQGLQDGWGSGGLGAIFNPLAFPGEPNPPSPPGLTWLPQRWDVEQLVGWGLVGLAGLGVERGWGSKNSPVQHGWEG